MRNYNIRLEGNPYIALMGAIVAQAREDANNTSRSDADRQDALKGIEEWRNEMEISLTLSDDYLNDRMHGTRI